MSGIQLLSNAYDTVSVAALIQSCEEQIKEDPKRIVMTVQGRDLNAEQLREWALLAQAKNPKLLIHFPKKG